ncbi:bifunctional phosphopantothenoylcysteine decarboxylase/phosphopantothenate--cysteine ligase CoaBC [Aureimonas flava]|uniref:Coenzyme A biosynthesis bifunctional protein CoaBC n=1 Tax=Aureimonas flava TaxID=2320271 RepID=A0A3A1WKN3_9HYPH|nr:bifunctional phosphopantothenoylcysteine decarboxylase/phosphopantothenate--cysteine ligase CoaBC [Aureimonas flava]RIY00819.1 bifunctional phosphopantothenoylcysteine decarboxylase/phosphopantothenate--cysteine ligase CoaBC [Aureimonas flava]
MSLFDKRILLIVGGGIAAYKCLDLVRRLRERGAKVTPVMTRSAAEFVTPLSIGALAGTKVYGELFDRDDEEDVGHIRLARGADLVIVAPASAARMGRMAAGIGDDLAGAVLLATRAPVLLAPAMNPAMWTHPATRRNVETLARDGIRFVGPNRGEMAESGEAGEGRMAEPLEIAAAAEAVLGEARGPLAGRHVLVTSGPTHEPIDPVRYIANRSSGRQGHAIAASLARLGARVTLVSGPVALPDPPGVSTVHVETGREMLGAVEAALPADAAVFVAAVADWRTQDDAAHKIKKTGDAPPALRLVENPDILRTVGTGPRRPALVVGFAAETRDLLENAAAKLARKGADLIVANDVSGEVMGGEANTVHLVSRSGVEAWPTLSKTEVAERLALDIARRLGPSGGA